MAPTKIVVQNTEALLTRYADGEPLEPLARDAGVSVGTIRRVLTEHGVQIRGRQGRRPRPLDDATIADLAAAYRAGASRYQLMTRIGDRNYNRVDAALTAAGVEIRNDLRRGGEDHPNYRGGPKRQDGYVLVHVPEDWPYPEMLRRNGNGNGRGRTIMEHRKVMAEHLGRALTRREIVHHRNGVRSDNRIENLELWTRAHPPGQRAHEHGVCPCCGERLICPQGHDV